MPRRIRLAWVSTYNSRCGLATHSADLLEHLSREVFDLTVFANHAEPVTPDRPEVVTEVVRLWSAEPGGLAGVRALLGGFDALLVNFHFSLIGLAELAATLQTARRLGVDAYVILHKTLDTVIDGRTVSLAEIAEDLARCTAVIVHTEVDIARLARLGVADNVVMIPLGVVDRPAVSEARARRLLGLEHYRPIIGTFGFLLPPKGLPQLIHAFAAVRRQFPDALLLLVNAQYPNADSIAERGRCLALIRALRLAGQVRLSDAFLETDEILLLLAACDLTLFAYQASDESDSGAVRLGLAAGRPVATTPLPIFANLEGVVHRLPGTAAGAIADGIIALLRDPAACQRLLPHQQAWVRSHSWACQAGRIGGLIRDGFSRRQSPPARSGAWRSAVTRVAPAPAVDAARAARLAATLAEPPPGPPPDLPVSPPSPAIDGIALEWLPLMAIGPGGQRTPAGIGTRPGSSGHLAYGPYAALAAGSYRVLVRYRIATRRRPAPAERAVAMIEVVCDGGETYLAQREIGAEERHRGSAELRFQVDPAAAAVEVRVWTSGAAAIGVSSIAIERIGDVSFLAAIGQPALAESE